MRCKLLDVLQSIIVASYDVTMAIRHSVSREVEEKLVEKQSKFFGSKVGDIMWISLRMQFPRTTISTCSYS